MWARIGTLIVITIAACYSPSPSAGAPCGPGGTCPEGLRCSVENLCVDPATPDPDGPPPIVDGPPDAPRKRWRIVQTEGAIGNDVTIAPTLGGTTLVVGIETSSADTVDSLTDDANNNYELIPESRAINTGENGIEIWMAKAASDGATKLIAIGPEITAIVVWEIENLAAVEVVDTLDDQGASTSPTGVTITTTAPGQFVVSILLVANTVTGLTPGSDFTNDHTTFGNGWAHLTDDDAPVGEYQPRWTQPMSGTSCASSVVFRTAD